MVFFLQRQGNDLKTTSAFFVLNSPRILLGRGASGSAADVTCSDACAPMPSYFKLQMPPAVGRLYTGR